MEAEEPPHGASIHIHSLEESRIIPEAVMRSSQMPVLTPEGHKGQDPSSKWTEGRRCLVSQLGELRDVNDYVAERKPSFPEEGSAEVEAEEEIPVAEDRDILEQSEEAAPQSLEDSGVKTRAHSGLWAHSVQCEWPDMVSEAREPGSRVELELKPERSSLTLGTGQGDRDDTSADTSSHAIVWPLSEKQLAETNQTCVFGSGPAVQLKEAWKSQEQEGLLSPQEAHGLETQDGQQGGHQGQGLLGENLCSNGLWRDQEQMVEQVNGKDGKEGDQQGHQERRRGGHGGRAGLSEELEDLYYGECDGEVKERIQGQENPEEEEGKGKRTLRGEEASRVDFQCAENQRLVWKRKEITREQGDQGVLGKEEQQEGTGSSEEEPESEDRGEQEAMEEDRSPEEKEEQDSPSPATPVMPEAFSSGDFSPDTPCPLSQILGTLADLRLGELSPRALTPIPETLGHHPDLMSLPGSFAPGGSLDNRIAHDRSEGAELKKGAMSSQRTELAPADISIPEGTPCSAPVRPAAVSAVSPSGSPAAIPKETPTASLLTHSPSARASSETPLAALRAQPAADPHAASHPATCPGTIQHQRSNSFPGSQRTEQAPDLGCRSLSFSHSELPQRPPKPAIYGSVIPRKNRRSGRDCSSISENPTATSTQTQDPSHAEMPRSQPWGSPQNSACATGSPACGVSPSTAPMDRRIQEPLPPPPLEKRHTHAPVVDRGGRVHDEVPTLKPHSHPPMALSSGLHGPPEGPLPQIPDPYVARRHRPLPSTPDNCHHTQPSVPTRLRYNKPLPPTPDSPQSHQPRVSPSHSSRMYRPLPPVPILNPADDPPPLPPKSRARSKSSQAGLLTPGPHTQTPLGQEWTVSAAPSAGRTSWPPATGRSAEALAPRRRNQGEASSVLAFSNMTNMLSPSSPTTPWTPELQNPRKVEAEAPVKGPLQSSLPQEGASGSRRSTLGSAGQPEKPSHPQLEKASSWPHRRDPGRPPEGGGSGGGQVVLGDGPSKHKGWNRQGLRRPSILPEASNSRSPSMGRSPGPSDTVVFREKRPKEGTGGFSRRCSKLINSSQLLYQEYSDVVLNQEIQSQQRLDSVTEAPGLASPRQPRKSLVSTSESYLQRLSVASSGSLWQEIPVVRNSTVLLSMTHEDQKLQEAKFELIVSEASYLRSLNIAVDHFQHSSQIRAIVSNQDHQWLFSRLQDVRDVSAMFLSDLEENFESNIFSFQVCDVVLSHAPDFRRVYLPYVTNQTYQERTFQSLMNSNSSFREVLEKLESDPICQRLSLKSFLILPFQRITRLKLLLQNILKRSQPGSSEEAEATKAHHALEELIRDCNSNVQRMRRTEELIYLSQKIEFECKIFPLISQSRWLVKSGELTALEFSVSPGLRRKLNTRPVHLHLFNDCLLLSRPREGSRFLVFDHAPFSSIRGEKCEMKLHGPHKNLFRLFLRQNAQGTQAEFLFSTETQSEKLRWISALAMPREELDLLECYDSPQVQCLRAYKPRENDELALEKADVVMVTQQSNDGWLEGMRLSDGERGWFPLQQVEFISNAEVRVRNLKEAHRVKTARLQLVEQQA
ncbi:PREDICTED: rho guanine nucleotide exchange factor 5 [Dipodomys ordii]|uniref:Rho guanine nucleotide exchange factor 5 n=1 Tax=Dipodomys ordii TaxID=10020 RepID=A0A1S3FMC4_DIPOR|nr:PREDICTED: rho guanine nucleotide exchange factor 5 [Dipodomys ordii]XP_012877174.1 PREDICTED: rho guanine nucleotide exchange factor 5 [Dipodomys ordii]